MTAQSPEPGASPAVSEKRQESRTRAYRNAYHRANYGTVSACLTRPEKEAFREACRRIGKTQHEVISGMVAAWMEEQKAFDYSAAVVFL